MKTEKILLAVTIAAAAALTRFRFVDFTGNVAGAGERPLGVATTDFDTGEQASVATHGEIHRHVLDHGRNRIEGQDVAPAQVGIDQFFRLAHRLLDHREIDPGGLGVVVGEPDQRLGRNGQLQVGKRAVTHGLSAAPG